MFAAIAGKIQTVDEHETLKYTLGVKIVSDKLKMHVEVAAKKEYPHNNLLLITERLPKVRGRRAIFDFKPLVFIFLFFLFD